MTRDQAVQRLGSKSRLRRLIYHGWLRAAVPNQGARGPLFDPKEVEAAAARMKLEKLPLIPWESASLQKLLAKRKENHRHEKAA